MSKTIDELRPYAKALANRWHEPALIVTTPPEVQGDHPKGCIPFVVLLSQATREELAAAVERIEPTN